MEIFQQTYIWISQITYKHIEGFVKLLWAIILYKLIKKHPFVTSIVLYFVIFYKPNNPSITEENNHEIIQ